MNKRQAQIDRYNRGDNPKGVWRAKKGRLRPTAKSVQDFYRNQRQLALERVGERLTKLFWVCVAMAVGLMLFWVAFWVEFSNTPLIDSLLRVFIAMMAIPFATFGVVGFWVYVIVEPLENLLRRWRG